jgi:hypothetical protein
MSGRCVHIDNNLLICGNEHTAPFAIKHDGVMYWLLLCSVHCAEAVRNRSARVTSEFEVIKHEQA